MYASVRTVIAAVGLASALVASGVATASADRVMTQNGIEYACTGIAESKDDPRWRSFALKLVYALEPDGALMTDVRARIDRVGGGTVLEVYCKEGPWLVARLAPGRYRITATAVRQYTKAISIVIQPGRQTYVVIRFPAAAGQ